MKLFLQTRTIAAAVTMGLSLVAGCTSEEPASDVNANPAPAPAPVPGTNPPPASPEAMPPAKDEAKPDMKSEMKPEMKPDMAAPKDEMKKEEPPK